MSPWRISGQFQRDGLLVLPVILNERVFRLLFDPGAAFSSVAPNVAAILKLQVVGSQAVFQGGYYPVSCPVYLLNSFQIGFIRRVNMRMIGMPLDPRLNFKLHRYHRHGFPPPIPFHRRTRYRNADFAATAKIKSTKP